MRAQQREYGEVAGYRAAVRGSSETRAAADEESARRPARCSASAEVHLCLPRHAVKSASCLCSETTSLAT